MYKQFFENGPMGFTRTLRGLSTKKFNTSSRAMFCECHAVTQLRFLGPTPEILISLLDKYSNFEPAFSGDFYVGGPWTLLR